MLSLVSVGLQRDFQWLVTDLSLVLKPGQCCHVVGANGIGKTTLLRTIAGLRPLDAGHIRWHEQHDHNDAQEQWRPSDYVLYYGHHAAVTGELTVADNCHHFARLAAGDDDQQRARPWSVADVLEQLELGHKRDVLAQELSAGQRQRVGLARLWFYNRPLWLLDEPLASLDTQTIALVEARIQAHCDQGGMVLMSSHQPLRCTTDELALADYQPADSGSDDGDDFWLGY